MFIGKLAQEAAYSNEVLYIYLSANFPQIHDVRGQKSTFPIIYFVVRFISP